MGVFASYASGLPDPAQLEDFQLAEGSRVISADGVELATFAAEQRRVVAFADLPQVMIDAQVAAEDRTFWTNPCIDFRGIAARRAAELLRVDDGLGRLDHLPAAGADPPLRRRPAHQSEAPLGTEDQGGAVALRVADHYPGLAGKQKLLEMYLNQVYYGNNAYGVWAAANRYFGKDITSGRSRIGSPSPRRRSWRPWSAPHRRSTRPRWPSRSSTRRATRSW